MRRNNVVLPQPEGPSIVTNSPFFTFRVTSSNAVLSPKYFDTWPVSYTHLDVYKRQALVPGIGNILGVRIPQLRILAKEIAKRDNWRMFVEATDTKFYEETMLQGMVIGLAKMELDERMKHISMFVPRIDNWAVCDIFCGELKTAVKKGKETV